jgi:hypothetical protein
MTVDEIIANIKTLAHDTALSNSKIQLFLNQATQELEGMGEVDLQYINDESVLVPSGTYNIVPAFPIKRVIKCSHTYIRDSKGLRLPEPVTEDTTVTLSYVRRFPPVVLGDDTTFILDDWFYVYGGTYFAMLSNLSPETEIYKEKFYDKMFEMFEDNAFFDKLPIANSEDIIGI